MPQAIGWEPKGELRERVVEHVKKYRRMEDVQNGKKGKAKEVEKKEERERVGGLERGRVTERMVSLCFSPLSF